MCEGLPSRAEDSKRTSVSSSQRLRSDRRRRRRTRLGKIICGNYGTDLPAHWLEQKAIGLHAIAVELRPTSNRAVTNRNYLHARTRQSAVAARHDQVGRSSEGLHMRTHRHLRCLRVVSTEHLLK